MGNNRSIGKQIFILCVVAAVIIASVVIYINSNNKRILTRNDSYITDAAVQSRYRVDDLIDYAQDSIYTISTLYSSCLRSEEIDEELLENMAQHSPFDYVAIISDKGIIQTSDEESIDVSGGKAYTEGMKGNSGVSVSVNDQRHDDTLFVYYAPLYYNGDIIGVMCGVYTDKSMESILYAEFFGMQAKTYLCDSSGQVLASSGDDEAPENLLDAVFSFDLVNEKNAEKVKNAFDTHTSLSYTYVDQQGEGNVYAAALESEDWMLVQAFPSEVTERMKTRSNGAGFVLVGCVIFTFVAYIVFLLLVKRRQTVALMNENKEIYTILKSVNQLFVRFVVVDFKEDTYSYIEKNEGIPPQGKYSELRKYMESFYVDDDEISMNELVTKESIQKELTKGKNYVQYEYHIRRDGMDRWENSSIICLKREGGKPVSVLYAVQDVTKLKQLEKESKIALKNAFDSAEAANRAKSEFLSRMSHDIRTPMNAVMGMTAVAAMHIDDKERVVDCLNKINTSSRHLLALINDVLDMSKIESGKVTLTEEPFNLAEMTESLITIMHPQINAKNQNISMSAQKIVHENVIGDTLRLRQVFVNIMGNAVKFTPEGGTITLEIKENYSKVPGKAYYEFVFSDNGIGMEEEFIEKIFEPFSRSKESSKIEGTGLGMPIARNIVRMMNGDIKVESKLGEGSKFSVRFYLTIQNIDEESTECLEDLKILVADDERDAADSTAEILRSIGMDASWVLSGTEAVETVVDRHEKGEDFAAVILDWKMPDKNGVEAAAEIRQRVGEEVPIIILSAYDWSEVEQEARKAGVNAFIAKPLFRSRLVYVLRSLISPSDAGRSSEIKDFADSDYSGRRVLLVEDNELNREVAGELLEMIGVEVEMAFDGQEAVDIVTEKPAGYYDLIFMDIQMPKKNGYDAASEIRSSDRDDLKTIPIVAMSADAFSDDIFRSKESGMNDHVAKPIEISRLSAVLEKWLG